MIDSTSISSFVQFGILLEEITFPFPSCSDIKILKFSRLDYEAWIVTDLPLQNGSGSFKYRFTQAQ